MPIETTRWPKLTSALWIKEGRSLACFDDGAWYAYVYHADAIPVRLQGTVMRYEAPFLKERRRDKRSTELSDLRGLVDSSEVLGLYRLDGTTRMIAHLRLRHRGKSLKGTGLTIVDHQNRFSGISTVWSSEKRLVGAGNGLLYLGGDHESLPDGNVGNPLIFRYRFVRPQTADG